MKWMKDVEEILMATCLFVCFDWNCFFLFESLFVCLLDFKSALWCNLCNALGSLTWLTSEILKLLVSFQRRSLPSFAAAANLWRAFELRKLDWSGREPESAARMHLIMSCCCSKSSAKHTDTHTNRRARIKQQAAPKWLRPMQCDLIWFDPMIHRELLLPCFSRLPHWPWVTAWLDLMGRFEVLSSNLCAWEPLVRVCAITLGARADLSRWMDSGSQQRALLAQFACLRNPIISFLLDAANNSNQQPRNNTLDEQFNKQTNKWMDG